MVATFTPHRAVTVECGFSWLDGSALFRQSASQDVLFAYASLELKY